jgi:hypothetical protein
MMSSYPAIPASLPNSIVFTASISAAPSLAHVCSSVQKVKKNAPPESLSKTVVFESRGTNVMTNACSAFWKSRHYTVNKQRFFNRVARAAFD